MQPWKSKKKKKKKKKYSYREAEESKIEQRGGTVLLGETARSVAYGSFLLVVAFY